MLCLRICYSKYDFNCLIIPKRWDSQAGDLKGRAWNTLYSEGDHISKQI